MTDAEIDHRDWNGYLSNGKNHLNSLSFTDKTLALEYVIETARAVAHDEISESDFEQVSDTVWQADLSGPYTGFVVHRAVYSEVPDAE